MGPPLYTERAEKPDWLFAFFFTPVRVPCLGACCGGGGRKAGPGVKMKGMRVLPAQAGLRQALAHLLEVADRDAAVAVAPGNETALEVEADTLEIC